jgi:hypothetical protein
MFAEFMEDYNTATLPHKKVRRNETTNYRRFPETCHGFATARLTVTAGVAVLQLRGVDSEGAREGQ